jgi:tight adherence protein C
VAIRIIAAIMIIALALLAFSFIQKKQRQTLLNRSMNIAQIVAAEKNSVQQLKQHHEAELVLQKKSGLLNIYRRIDGSIYYKIALAGLFIALIIAVNLFFSLEISRNNLTLIGIVILVAAIVLPGILRAAFVKRRVKKLSAELPWLVDLLAVSVQCGMTVDQAFVFLSQKMTGINPDFAPFLQRLVRRTEVGGLSPALKLFYQEIPGKETRMLCAMLEQSLQYGSSMYDQLIELSREIREVQLLTIEEHIGKLGAKMSVPLILFFMIPVVVIVAAPGVMRVLANV